MTRVWAASLPAGAAAVLLVSVLAACAQSPQHHASVRTVSSATASTPSATAAPVRTKPGAPSTTKPPPAGASPHVSYPWHTNIVSTTFWVGEIFDPNASDGSQVISTYDSHWYANYGGCDGVIVKSVCGTQKRTAANGYFPLNMTPKQNPFYLDLPFDDVNDPTAFKQRGSVVPWAKQPAYASKISDPNFSLMKNRWVELTKDGHACYGQIEDAGPGEYDDTNYVFGTTNARPQNTRYGGAGLDVSPALNGCLGYADLNGDDDHVSWRFVDADAVPNGPWKILVTTTPVEE